MKEGPSRASAASPAARRTYRGLVLNPFQEEALEAIAAGRSVLLSAPTGAGKTLVAEYAIEETLKRGRRAIYTAPIKALSNQKYRDFKADPGIDVGIMTGDVTINPGAPLLVMTTEIFRNTVFESPGELGDVEYVVFDEIHYMDDLERGTVWEESIIFAPPQIKLICLSATVSNLGQFGQWIRLTRAAPLEIIHHGERPVPLRHYIFFPGHGPLRADKAPRFPRAGPRKRTRGPKHNVIDLVQQNGTMPILFFCFSRKECEERARNHWRRHFLQPVERRRMEQHFEEVCDLYGMAPDGV
ncbi:MAG: DEAD/DEAH box helicase, partial [Planctomycetes bacterium]|nr:DEAD/DEAH box helicase [Planctomycetota bacterium]